jgi:hypothetical protein
MPPHMNGASPGGVRGPRWGYPPQHGGQWWGNGWNAHAPYPYGDDTSVQSGLSGDSYSQHYDMNGYHGQMHHPQYYPPMMYPQHQLPPGQPQGPYDPNMADPTTYPLDPFNPDPMASGGWAGHLHVGHVPPQSSEAPGFPGTSGAPVPSRDMHSSSRVDGTSLPLEQPVGDHTPYKFNPNQVPMSPYWGHLDHATLAMMGIGTPQASSPQTPSRGGHLTSPEDKPEFEVKHDNNSAHMSAQPLLLRQQYYGYGVSTNLSLNGCFHVLCLTMFTL